MTVRTLVRRAARATAALIVVAAAPAALATDHFLTIGGGDAPTHNQVSLEKNVLYLQRVLDDLSIGQSHHDIFFSDGTDPGRDLQCHGAGQVPKVNRLLARVLTGNESALAIEYRDQSIAHVAGPSNRKSLGEWFDKTGKSLDDGDRLVIYFTGHGGGGQRNSPRNTNLTMWREQSMPVKEFVGLLDKLPPKVRVVIVMVQCHSGGFADVIFKNGDFSAKPDGLSAAPRAGFFATVPERPAAGCTPDINEENYREYSTYFWEALSGKTRLGSGVRKPDYDGDGKVSFAEAHAYVKLTSTTIDIPVCTSDNFLRAFSRTGAVWPRAATPAAPTAPASPTAAPGGPATRPVDGPPRPRFRRRDNPDAAPSTRPSTQPTSDDPARQAAAAVPAEKPAERPEVPVAPPQASGKLFGIDSPYHELVATADPARKAVLDGLSEQLGLSGPERAKAARELATKVQKEREDVEGQKRQATKDGGPHRDRLAQAVRARWPELAVAFHPRQAEILRTEADAVVKFIEAHEAYKPLERQRDLAEKLDARSDDLERKWVKAQRFLRTLEDVALAANLPKVATPEVQKRYAELLKAEYGSL